MIGERHAGRISAPMMHWRFCSEIFTVKLGHYLAAKARTQEINYACLKQATLVHFVVSL
jgi:hypothetical protein